MRTDLISHLEELRGRLIVCLIAFATASAVSWFFSAAILEFLTLPLKQTAQTEALYFQSPYEAFLVRLEVAVLSGVILASPVLFMQLWFFIAPGLYRQEKGTAFFLISASVGLFLIGVLFAFAVVVPVSLRFFVGFQTDFVRPLLGIKPYFSFLTGTILAFGLLFEFPALVVGLVRLGVLSSGKLVKARKVIVVTVFFVAAVLTPSPDPLSQILLAVPLLGLFELSILLARFIEKTRRRRAVPNPA